MQLEIYKLVARPEDAWHSGSPSATWAVELLDGQDLDLWVLGSKRGDWFALSGLDDQGLSLWIADYLKDQRFHTRRELLEHIQALLLVLDLQ